VQFDGRPGVLRRAEGEPDVFEGTGKSQAAAQMGRAGRAAQRLRRAPPSVTFPAPTRRLGTGLEHLAHRDSFGKRRADRENSSFAQDIPPANLHRIDLERLGQQVHLSLGGVGRLRSAKTAERSTWNIVGIDRIGVDFDVGNVVGAGAQQGGVAQNLGGGVGIGPAVLDEFNLRPEESTFARGAPFRPDGEGVPFVVAEDRLLA